jgi:hypothetical protein
MVWKQDIMITYLLNWSTIKNIILNLSLFLGISLKFIDKSVHGVYSISNNYNKLGFLSRKAKIQR